MTETGIQRGGVVTFHGPYEMRLSLNKKYKEESMDLRRLRNEVFTLSFYTKADSGRPQQDQQCKQE